MSVGIQARADRRALTSAAFLGSSFGLALGAIYLLAGLAPATHTHSAAVRLARESRGEYAETMLQRSMNGKRDGVEYVARTVATAIPRDPLQAWPGRFGARLPLGRRASMIEAERDLDCLTEAVYFEGRSESDRGQAAIAQVVMNRLASPNFPKTVCGVVFQGAQRAGCQFTFACDGAMTRPLELAAWDRARKIAEQALAGVRIAAIGEATHYHTVDVVPYWNVSMLRVAQVGLHIFYRVNPRWTAPAEDEPQRAVFASSTAPPGVKLIAAAVSRSLEVPSAARPVDSVRAAETAAVPAAETAGASHGIAEPAAF